MSSNPDTKVNSNISPTSNSNGKISPRYELQVTINFSELLGGNFYNLLAYPFYRKFLEYKFFGLQKFSQNIYFPNNREINVSIKNRNGFYTGATGYFLAHLVQLNYKEFDEDSSIIKLYSFFPKLFFKNEESQEIAAHFLFSSVCLFFSYPIFLNSNNKAINSEFYKNLSNPRNLLDIYRKYYNRGALIYLFNGLIGHLPLVNLLVCYRLESIRIAYVYGVNDKGEPLNTYKQAMKYVTDNDSIWRGRWYYNLMFVPYYYNFIRQLIEPNKDFYIQFRRK